MKVPGESFGKVQEEAVREVEEWVQDCLADVRVQVVRRDWK